eukprot:sb/3472245/
MGQSLPRIPRIGKPVGEDSTGRVEREDEDEDSPYESDNFFGNYGLIACDEEESEEDNDEFGDEIEDKLPEIVRNKKFGPPSCTMENIKGNLSSLGRKLSTAPSHNDYYVSSPPPNAVFTKAVRFRVVKYGARRVQPSVTAQLRFELLALTANLMGITLLEFALLYPLLH